MSERTLWDVVRISQSWRKRATVLLLALLILAALFLGWTSYNYTSEMRKTIEEENARTAVLWANMTEARFGTLYEHIYELLISLYNNTELRFDTPIMSARARIRIVDMMNEKLLVNDDADAFFVFDTDNDYFLFSAKNGLSGPEVLDIKTYARENALTLSGSFGNRDWSVHPIGSAAYFIKCVRLGKYAVGTISNVRYYAVDQMFNLLGEDTSCTLETEDALYACGGERDITETADAEALRRGRADGCRVVSTPLRVLDGTLFIAARTGSLLGSNSVLAALLVLDSAGCLFLVIYLLILMKRKVSRPTEQLMEANRRLAAGETDYRLDSESAGSREFEALYDSYNDMAEQIVKLRIEAYDMKLAEEENKLTMLRAQLKPHTFLNAITTISNMTYSSPPEEIRAYIADFAKFVRYMLRTNAPWTTAEEEIKNIRSYLNMLERRSPETIGCTVECEPEAAAARIPYLLLFTLVENSVKHAMTLYAPMELRIVCRCAEDVDFRGVVLAVEDNGDGFPPEVIEKFLDGSDDPVFTKEHLGLSNVRYTLNLVYHRRDLLRLSNREGGGARVEIWIPEVPSDEASDL